MPAKTGIYCIKNVANGKVYVGQSRNVMQRFSGHRSYLRKGKHTNSYLQASWTAHGEKSFVFSLLEDCAESSLSEAEMFWIETLESTDRQRGYNLQSGGYGGYPTDEIRQKMSANSYWKGKPGFWHGKTFSEAYKKKLQEAAATRPTQNYFGKTHSEETRERLSRAGKGRLPPNARAVIRLDNDARFSSGSDAARSVNGNPSKLNKALREGRPYKGVIFVYEDKIA